MWSTCNFKKFDVNCCETVNVRPNLSEMKSWLYCNVVGNCIIKAFLLSSNLQRNTEVHKALTQICMHICGTVLMVAVLASLTDGGNLSHFNLKSHNYSVPLRWILPTLYCKQNVLSVGKKREIFKEYCSFLASTGEVLGRIFEEKKIICKIKLLMNSHSDNNDNDINNNNNKTLS